MLLLTLTLCVFRQRGAVEICYIGVLLGTSTQVRVNCLNIGWVAV